VITYDRSHQILDQYGRLIYYQIVDGENINTTIDFKLQPDGRISYFNTGKLKWFLMDSTFTVVDSILCTNFVSDQHDIQVLRNNHYLMFAEETRIMNLSSFHWFGFNHNQPGSTNAQVSGVVIQEFDENKSLVWEWKAHDHYQFGDVDQKWLQNPNRVDWTHANAVEQDKDGNILLSLRHFDEITKIDHSTGDIIWRLGGKQNQFTFPNDPLRFTGQHDIRRVSDSSITMFDNGQYTNPAMGRGLEYSLDETNKIATLIWEYVYDSSMYSLACGSHQIIGNGNHLIDFGFWAGTNPWMVIVKPDKSKVMELSSPDNFISYRAFNYTSLPWQLQRPVIECQKIGNEYYLVAEPCHPEYRWSTGATTPSIPITETGEYWVFVPYGEGFLSSERIKITDIFNPCTQTGISPTPMADEIRLQIMPNPASEKVRICFNLSAETNVIIDLTNELGILMQRTVEGSYPAGSHEITMNALPLNKGVYFITLRTEKTQITKKLFIQ
jgi:hypothetical protein